MKRKLLVPDNTSLSEIDWLARAIGLEVLALISTYSATSMHKRGRFGMLPFILPEDRARRRNLRKFDPLNPRGGNKL